MPKKAVAPMDAKEYKYDVAFSFLAQDEALATEVNDLLQVRVKTFLYSKKQEEIAGTDGEKSFNAVFGEQSRLVVVLYRKGWGQTPWTRIEETAIRNRGFEHGYDFAKFLPLDDPPIVPKWLPRPQIWVGLKRWGVAGAASVIEARIEELGGEAHEESVQERVARLGRTLKFEERRKHFLNSEEGVNASIKEFENLRAEFERLIAASKTAAPSITLQMKIAHFQIVVLGLRHGLSLSWRYSYTNSLKDSQLVIELWNGHPPFPGIMFVRDRGPRKQQTLHFTFDLLPSEEVRWISSASDKRSYTTTDLVSFALKYFMDSAGAT